MDPRPVVLYIVGYEWEGGCRVLKPLFTADEVLALVATGEGWIVMPDRQAMADAARYDQLQLALQQTPKPRISW